jgi:hypothetical protein
MLEIKSSFRKISSSVFRHNPFPSKWNALNLRALKINFKLPSSVFVFVLHPKLFAKKPHLKISIIAVTQHKFFFEIGKNNKNFCGKTLHNSVIHALCLIFFFRNIRQDHVWLVKTWNVAGTVIYSSFNLFW